MGQLCSKSSQISSKAINTEPEISLKAYKNDVDKYYDLIENKYNYLRKVPFDEFFYSLFNFCSENSTLEEDYSKASSLITEIPSKTFLADDFSNDYFQSFLENKILRNKNIIEEAGNNEKVTNIFKFSLLRINEALELKLSQYYKNSKGIEKKKNECVKKVHAISYGILFCSGANYIKIRVLFNVFKNGEGKIQKSDNFNEFLLALALIPSYSMVSTRNKLSNQYEEFEQIDKELLKKLVQISELKDCENLMNIINKALFGENETDALNYNEFKMKFDSSTPNSVNYMLSPRGIRNKIIENDVQTQA